MDNNLKIVNKEGSPVGNFLIEDRLIELQKGQQAVQDVVVAYRAGLRAGTACTKNRGEVNGPGGKPWRQKGTGRARSGSKGSPVWVGGGVAFGPKPRDFSKKVNKKVKQLALRRAFSEKLNESAVHVVDAFPVETHKTKAFVDFLKSLNFKGKVMIVVKDYDENIISATANIPYALLLKSSAVNVYQLLLCDDILFSEEALKDFVGRL